MTAINEPDASLATPRPAALPGRPDCWITRLLLILLLVILAIGPAARAAAFRFAWLSDTHIGSETAAEDLRASVRDINSQTGLSFVVISGDVTEYGSREQLRLTRSILDELRIPFYIIPGNHDTKWSESGATDFARIFGNDRFVFEHEGFRFIGMHQGPLMKMGDGHWAPQDVRWLDQVLRSLPDRQQPIIFITHYPLDDSIANWYEVLDRLKRLNTQAALYGHGHANRKQSHEGLPGVMGRSNLRARQPVGGYNLVEITADEIRFSERITGRETLSPWHTLPVGPRDDALDTQTVPRPDFSLNAWYPGVRERWRQSTGFTIASTPALWRGSAIVGDASGTVYSFDVDKGKIRWRFRTGNAVYSTPDVAGNRVVLASTDGNVYALNAATGRELWRFATERPIVASPRIADGLVFIGSSEGKFRALDLANGRLRWEFEGVRGFVETRPLVYQNKVIFGAWDGFLYALEAATGRLLWKWQGDRPGALFSPAACWPVAVHGRVFIVAPDRKMTALRADTGTEIWRTGEYMVRESIGLAEDGSRFYVRAMQDRFYAFATGADAPQNLWEQNAGFGYDINSAMLVEKDGTLFYGTKNSLLFALNPQTGEVRWRYKTGVGVMNTVLPLSSRSVLVTDFDGFVIRVDGPN